MLGSFGPKKKKLASLIWTKKDSWLVRAFPPARSKGKARRLELLLNCQIGTKKGPKKKEVNRK